MKRADLKEMVAYDFSNFEVKVGNGGILMMSRSCNCDCNNSCDCDNGYDCEAFCECDCNNF